MRAWGDIGTWGHENIGIRGHRGHWGQGDTEATGTRGDTGSMGCCGGLQEKEGDPAAMSALGPPQVEAGQADGPPARAQMTVAPVEAVSGRFLLLGGPGGPLQPGEVLRLQLRDLGPPPAPRLFHVLVSSTPTGPLGIHPLPQWGPPGTTRDLCRPPGP